MGIPEPQDEIVLSVLMVTYRSPELTERCLASVFEQTPDLPFEVIVVDNASGDGTPEMIAARFPQIRLYAQATNLGFAAGTNLAANHARGEWLVLLNPDTIVHDRALERLVEFARSRPAAAAFGGRTLRPDGGLDPRSCFGRQTPWSALCFAAGLSTLRRGSVVLNPEAIGSWQRDSEQPVPVISGCLLLLRSATWDLLGGFDTAFWMYGEDVDLCERLRREVGPLLFTPTATVTHIVGGSSETEAHKMAQIMHGRVAIMDKHWAPWSRRLGVLLLQTGVGLRAAGSRIFRPLRPGRKRHLWEEVWQQRHQWRRGYPG